MVSSIIMGSSLGLFGVGVYFDYDTNFEEDYTSWQRMIQILFYYCISISLFSSCHTTITFTLCALYCCSSLATGGDEYFIAFERSTGLQRKNGFLSFVASIVFFMSSF